MPPIAKFREGAGPQLCTSGSGCMWKGLHEASAYLLPWWGGKETVGGGRGGIRRGSGSAVGTEHLAWCLD